MKEAQGMAETIKTEFQTGVYTEQGRRSSGKKLKESDNSYIIGPGIDLLYEFLYRYGLHISVVVLTYLSFWIIWAVDFSGGH
jgi:hypothetical protein